MKKRNNLFIFPLVILLLLGIFKWVKQQLLWTYDIENVLQAPSVSSALHGHIFGTDMLGRDFLFRILIGLENTLSIGLFSLLLGGFIGGFLGCVIGFQNPNGKVDKSFILVLDLLQSVPQLFLCFIYILIIQKQWGDFLSPYFQLTMALAATSWMPVARTTRLMTRKLQQKNYVEASVALGASRWQLAARHAWVDLRQPLFVYLIYLLPQFFIFESVISFFGFGIKYPDTSLGLLIQDGWKMMMFYPHLFFLPAVCLLTVLLLLKKSTNRLLEVITQA